MRAQKKSHRRKRQHVPDIRREMRLRRQKLERLRSAIERGEYFVSGAKVAAAMLAEDVGLELSAA